MRPLTSSRASNILRCSASAARWRAEGWLHTVDAFGEKLRWRQRLRGGSFPRTQTRTNGWGRSELPRAVLPGRPFGGWSLNTVSTPPPRLAVSVYSARVLTPLRATGPSESHQPLPPYRHHPSRYKRWFQNTFHKTTPRFYVYIIIHLHTLYRVYLVDFRRFVVLTRWDTLPKPRTNFASLAEGTGHYLIPLLTFHFLYSFGFL